MAGDRYSRRVGDNALAASETPAERGIALEVSLKFQPTKKAVQEAYDMRELAVNTLLDLYVFICILYFGNVLLCVSSFW
jgi:hypothetical protein